jgi:hypothetical protein
MGWQMGIVIDFRAESHEKRRRLREAVHDVKCLVARAEKPEIKAALQAHLDRYAEKLEAVEKSMKKTKHSASLGDGSYWWIAELEMDDWRTW